jgi:hypothetical protein
MSDSIVAAVIGAVATIFAAVLTVKLSQRKPQSHIVHSKIRPLTPGGAQGSLLPESPKFVGNAPTSLSNSSSLALPLDRVIPDARLRAAVSDIFSMADPGARLGGITIRPRGRDRALVYVGPCPPGLDKQVREIVKFESFEVSTVRDLRTFGNCITATLNDPKDY